MHFSYVNHLDSLTKSIFYLVLSESITTKRSTKQRSAISQAFASYDRPLSPEEVLGHAKRLVPHLGIATVYRAINALLAEGWLVPVTLPGEATRYEVSGKRHHHHFRCRDCEQVFEIDGCPGNFTSLVPQGFTLEEHHLVLFGLCHICGQ